jgi:myo-inositol-1(or 4)-monophosphatase
VTAHGFPQFCVSIAYERRGRVEFAVVFDALKRELFVAARGRGARPDARPIHVTATPSLDRAPLATSFPYDRRERRNFYFTLWETFMMRTQQRTGSGALDLCYVACRRVDAFWEFGLRPWGAAAGALIVAEAG